jgi:heme/copper-type cytochrome/quinol oxidase subunit 4
MKIDIIVSILISLLFNILFLWLIVRNRPVKNEKAVPWLWGIFVVSLIIILFLSAYFIETQYGGYSGMSTAALIFYFIAIIAAVITAIWLIYNSW